MTKASARALLRLALTPARFPFVLLAYAAACCADLLACRRPRCRHAELVSLYHGIHQCQRCGRYILPERGQVPEAQTSALDERATAGHPALRVYPALRAAALAVAFLFLADGVAPGQSPAAAPALALPAEVHGDSGDFVTVKATTACATVKWVALDKALRLFPVELLRDTKTAVVIGKQPGRYQLLAYTAAGDVPSDPALCTVVIDGVPTPPPPPPPPPTDPFVQALQTAYDADTAASMPKPAALAQLLALRQQAVKQAQTTTVAKLADVHTNVHQVIQQVLGDDLKGTRRSIANHWPLPTDTATPLDAATRARLVAEYDAVAKALAQVQTTGR